MNHLEQNDCFAYPGKRAAGDNAACKQQSRASLDFPSVSRLFCWEEWRNRAAAKCYKYMKNEKNAQISKGLWYNNEKKQQGIEGEFPDKFLWNPKAV